MRAKALFFAPRLYEIPSIRGPDRAKSSAPSFTCDPLLARDDLPIAWSTDINGTGFGLTCAIHTRIARRAEELAARLKVGNVYVNRNQIGAAVGVQPFGGEGLSGTGPKAGGPHYLHRFALERVVSDPDTVSGPAATGAPSAAATNAAIKLHRGGDAFRAVWRRAVGPRPASEVIGHVLRIFRAGDRDRHRRMRDHEFQRQLREALAL